MASHLRREMDVAAELAREAGEITLRYFQSGVEARKKADASPVTIADLEAEKHIRARLASIFPDDGIFGEEGGETAGTSGRTWVVDPIDGTKSFIQGVPLYSVLIALEVNETPVVGVIHLPALDELVCAAAGEGCFWNGARAAVSSVDRLDDACVLYTSADHFERYAPTGDALRRQLFDRARVVRGWGDGYGYALVATGRAEAMFDPIVNPWDIAPMVPILEEAGGRFTDWSGRRSSRVTCGLGTNGALHDELLALARGESASW